MFGSSWLVASWIGLMMAPTGNFGQERKPAAPDLERAKEQIVAATNQFRKEEKRRELKVNAELSKAAQAFAEFMARTDKYGHEADGKKPAERVTDAGYAYCIVAENIAYQFNSGGFTTADLAKGFIQGWKDSPPHRKNMLDSDMYDIGVGLARSEKSGKYYAVQDFGRPKSQEIKVEIINHTGDTVKYTLGDESFSINSQYTVTHRLCRPSDLQVQQPEGNKGGEPLHTGDGARYILRKDNSGVYKVEKK